MGRMARLTLRLDFGPGRAIGHGKIRLLEAVRDHGSISAAGRSMDMSYRRAWLLIDELNELFEGPVIETKHRGSGVVARSSRLWDIVSYGNIARWRAKPMRP